MDISVTGESISSCSIYANPKHVKYFDAIDIDSFVFDAFCYSEKYFILVMTKIYNDAKFGRINIKFKKYIDFVKLVFRSYNNLPYHNSKHSIDVVVNTYHIIKIINKKKRLLSNIEIFSLVIAMLSHDAGHFGRTNPYIAKNYPEMVEKYGEVSTLEYYHLDITKIALKHSDVLSNFSNKIQNHIIKIIDTTIIATDIFTTKDLIMHPITDITKDIMYKTIAKCADIGHVYKSFAIHKKWTNAIQLELGLFCENICSTQCIFFDKYAIPLFEFANLVFKDMNEITEKVYTNKAHWLSLVE